MSADRAVLSPNASRLLAPLPVSPPIQVHGWQVTMSHTPRHVQLHESGLGGVGTWTRISWYLITARKDVDGEIKGLCR